MRPDPRMTESDRPEFGNVPSLRAPLFHVLCSLDDEDRLRHPRPEARKAPEGFGISWARRTWNQELVTRESNGLTLSATTGNWGGDAGKRTGARRITQNLRRIRIPSCRGWARSLAWRWWRRLPWLSIGVLLGSVVKNRKVTKTGEVTAAENS